jgi:hypothetical protein
MHVQSVSVKPKRAVSDYTMNLLNNETTNWSV